MPLVQAVEVESLFGHLSQQVKIRTADHITILTGPNGSGKTHLLRLLAGIAGLEFTPVARLPFRSAAVTYDDGRVLRVTKKSLVNSSLEITGTSKGKVIGEGEVDPLSHLDESTLPQYIAKLDEDLWIDTRDGEELTGDLLVQRFRVKHGLTREEVCERLPWLTSFAPTAAPTLIETGRLETVPDVPMSLRRTAVARTRRPEAEGRIAAYTERITQLITDARRTSLSTSQQADRRFPARALDKARISVKERELRERYERVSELHQALHRNGLTEESIGVVMPTEKTNPTERRILNVFLEDWEAKLAPLLPVHEKLELWRSVVASKLAHKSIHIDARGSITFRSADGDVIPVSVLSSGEQHLVALYTMLLFAATPTSLVLIDEPEISLHAAWKHAFLDDISQIARTNELQVILATHSTGIINGRWDLVEELTLTQVDQ